MGFGPAPDLCEAVDYAPVFDIVAVDRLEDDDELGDVSEGLYQRSCLFMLDGEGALGTLSVYAAVHSDDEGAGNQFADKVDAYGGDLRELTGDWDEAVALRRPGGDDEADVRLVLRDGTLLVDVWTFITGDAAAADTQEAALLEVADRVRAALRSSTSPAPESPPVTSPEAPSGGYVVRDDLCDQVDLTTVAGIAPPTSDRMREHRNDADGVTFLECFVDVGHTRPIGTLWIDVSVHDTPRLAALRHQSNVELGRMAEAADTMGPVDGPWQAGTVGLGTGRGQFDTGAEVCVHDGNVAACVRLHLSPDDGAGEPPTDEDVAAAIRPVAEDVLDLLSEPRR